MEAHPTENSSKDIVLSGSMLICKIRGPDCKSQRALALKSLFVRLGRGAGFFSPKDADLHGKMTSPAPCWCLRLELSHDILGDLAARRITLHAASCFSAWRKGGERRMLHGPVMVVVGKHFTFWLIVV